MGVVVERAGGDAAIEKLSVTFVVKYSIPRENMSGMPVWKIQIVNSPGLGPVTPGHKQKMISQALEI